MRILSADEYDAIYAMTGMDIDNRRELMDGIVQRVTAHFHAMVKFARSIPGFTSIPPNEQVELIQCQ